MSGSNFTSMLPKLAIPGRGVAGVDRPADKTNTGLRTGQVWSAGLGNARYRLGVLLNQPGQFYNDLDLFQSTAANQMVMTNMFVWKLCTESSMNSLTAIAAPKVAVPNDIHTFSGKTMYYHVQPANDVPKRGQVRTMNKSFEEWVAHLSQKGMGSFIEGGSLRRPEGAQFLDQEMVAISWSLELNMAINTAQTLVNAAMASGYNFNRSTSVSFNAISMGSQLMREYNTFCCGCGSSRNLSSIISAYQQVVPNADMMYMSSRCSSALTFNDEKAGLKIPHRSYAMIPDVSGSANPVAIRSSTSTTSIKTIFGTIAVLNMPTFSFRGGQIKYYPLEHELTTGNLWIMNADRGMVTWDKQQVPNSDVSDQNYYKSSWLDIEIYDHNLDRRTPQNFSTVLDYCKVFRTSSDEYVQMDQSESSVTNAVRQMYSEDMYLFWNTYKTISSTGTSKMQELYSKLDDCNTYTNSVMSSSSPGISSTSIVNELPLENDPISFHNMQQKRMTKLTAINAFKAHVQYPLSRKIVDDFTPSVSSATIVGRTYAINTSKSALFNFVLPTKIGELDPFHLTGVKFKSMVVDYNRRLKDLFSGEQYANFRALKHDLCSGDVNPDYWALVLLLNRQRLFDSKGGLLSNENSYIGLSEYRKSKRPLTSNLKGFPVLSETRLLKIPTYDEYIAYMSAIGKPNHIKTDDEYIPQGMWSVAGLDFLSRPTMINKKTINERAASALAFLGQLATIFQTTFPYSTLNNAKDSSGSILRFIPSNTVIMESDYNLASKYDLHSSNTSRAELMQIIMTILSDDYDELPVVLSPFKDDVDEVESITMGQDDDGRIKFSSSQAGQSFDSVDFSHLHAMKFEKTTAGGVKFNVKSKDGNLFIVELKDASAISVDPFQTVFSKKNETSEEKFVTYAAQLARRLYPSASFNLQAVDLDAKATPQYLSTNGLDQIKEKPKNLSIRIIANSGAAVGYTTAFNDTKFLTPFVICYKSSNINSRLNRTQSPISVYSHDLTNKIDLKPAQPAPGSPPVKDWKLVEFESRIETVKKTVTASGWDLVRYSEFIFGGPQYKKKIFSAPEKLVAYFIMETQMSLHSLKKIISEGIRPPGCEAVLWRLWQRQSFEGFLLGKSGISTAMNPFNNLYVNMGENSTSDEFHVRAVLQTDCVVLNSNNLIFIPYVLPIRYLGGRNNIYVSHSSDVRNPYAQIDKMPSIIATLVSDGYMQYVDNPVSFVNNPPGKIYNGIVDDPDPLQKWPGFLFYATQVYKDIFMSSELMYKNNTVDVNSTTHRSIAEYLRNHMRHNHIATTGYCKRYDPATGSLTYEQNGVGHYSQSYMNSTGAKLVFEGVETLFPLRDGSVTSNS